MDRVYPAVLVALEDHIYDINGRNVPPEPWCHWERYAA